MKLKEVFTTIDYTANEIGSGKPYIVGGMVRDILLKRFDQVEDIDITCGNKNSDNLGQALISKFPNATYTKFSDGHGSLRFDKFHIDFSNNFVIPGIESLIPIKNANDLQKEVYSRDFTINSLLMPLNLSKVYDLTNRGLKDIRDHILDTCLDPEITFSNDPRRLVRIIYLCSKLGFSPSVRISSWVKANKQLINKIPEKYLKDRLNSALSKNKDIAMSLINNLGFNEFMMDTGEYSQALSEDPELLFKALNE